MKELPKNQLDPRIRNVWRINDAIWLTLVFLLLFIPFVFVLVYLDANDDAQLWCLITIAVIVVVYAMSLILWLVILPPIRFMRWRYELSDDFLDIAKGIIWRKRYIIPFIRVQNTDTRQGPILRAFGLMSVTVSTAAGEHEIPGLKAEVAEQLRDRAAELARLAQEDV